MNSLHSVPESAGVVGPPAPRPRPTAAIVYLTQNTPIRRTYLQTSLYLLFRSFNERCRYPVLVFHEGDFTEKDMEMIKGGVPGGLGDLVQFQQVDPDDFHPPVLSVDVVEANRMMDPYYVRNIGYRSMCRWWMHRAVRYLGPYEYYMRLDDDSFIEEPLDYDPFEAVHAAGVDYASNFVHVEYPLNTMGLLDLSRDLLGDTDRLRSLFFSCKAAEVVEPSKLKSFVDSLPGEVRQRLDLDILSSPIIYYNNFHVARTSLWRHRAVARFFDAVDRSACIYYLRWGDAALHTIAFAAVEGLTVGRLAFRYSKRYEREKWTYVNTYTPFTRRYFESDPLPVGDRRTGSMTDFDGFNEELAARGLSDLSRIIA